MSKRLCKLTMDIETAVDILMLFWCEYDGGYKYYDLMREHYKALFEIGCFDEQEFIPWKIVQDDMYKNIMAFSPDEKDKMLKEYRCLTLKELHDSGCIMTECEHGWVCIR